MQTLPLPLTMFAHQGSRQKWHILAIFHLILGFNQTTQTTPGPDRPRV